VARDEDNVCSVGSCPFAYDVAMLKRKVVEGNGHDSLEVRMNAVELNLESIATSMATLVASEKTAMRYIEREQAKESTREHDKADRTNEVRTDLERADKKKEFAGKEKDRRLYVLFGVAGLFVTLLVGASDVAITIHDDHLQAEYQKSIEQRMGVNR
jgi:hypothetical protein